MKTLATPYWRWLGLLALVVGLALPAQAQRNVTLRLNTATIPDTVRAEAVVENYLEVRGGIDDTAPVTLPSGEVLDWSAASEVEYTNVGGDYWEVSFQIPNDAAMAFKNWSWEISESSPPDINTGWETGNNNYMIEAGTGDVEMPLHYFNATGGDQPYDWRPFGAEGDSVAVWFRVYMNTVDANTRGYDPEDEQLQVGMRGNFGTLGAVGANGEVLVDWGEIAPIEQESDNQAQPGYHLYSGVVKYPASAIGQQASYKFYFQGSETTGDAGYEDGNDRSFTVPAQDTTLHWVYYSNSPPVQGELVTSQITFVVDSEPLSAVGILDLTRGDRLQVRGGFNGWDCPADNDDDCGLFAIPGTLNFGNVIPVESAPGTQMTYKYFAHLEGIVDPNDPDTRDLGYEEPLDVGGGNRTFIFAGTAEQDIGLQFYNSIREGNVIPEGEGSIELTFRVDMTPAMSYAGETAFDPSTDNVYVAFEDQIWRLTQGYEPGHPSIDPAFTLSHVGDNIYEGTYTVQAPTYNGIGYAYAWGESAEATTREGAGGFDPGRRRYRYIMANGGGDFPAAYAFAQDVIVGADDPTPWECNPTSPTYEDDTASGFCMEVGFVHEVSVEPTGVLPTAVALKGNYPNPFRGTTTFEYAVAEPSHVTLAVYDLLGRQVATLVDGPQAADTYRVRFNADGLASGVYVVRLNAAGNVLSQRITVLR